MKVIDFCYCEEKDRVYKISEKEFFDGGNYREYYENMVMGSLDEIWFKFEDVDKNLFVILDGGDVIRLKNGKYVNVCWRGSMCRVWEMDNWELEVDLNDMRKWRV